MTTHFHRLTISDVRRETSEAVSIAFDIPEALAATFAFRCGQYVTVRAELGGEEVRRAYSVCSGETDGELRIGIKRVDGGLFSTYANGTLKPGDTLDVMAPLGRFGDAVAAGARTLVGFAAGSGITPMLSIIRTVLAADMRSRFTLVYANRSSSTILFKDDLDALKDLYVGRLGVHHVLSREMQDIAVLSGRLDQPKVAAFMRTVGRVETIDAAFLCGPGDLVVDIAAALASLGLPADRVHRELFSTGTERARPAPRERPAAVAAAGPRLTVRIDGAAHAIAMHADETVLEAALRSGLDLPYSCRGGMCCTCRAHLSEGAATMDQNFSLEPWEMAAGFVLTCQCRPTTPAIEIDFDRV